jgi:hypothetical protein
VAQWGMKSLYFKNIEGAGSVKMKNAYTVKRVLVYLASKIDSICDWSLLGHPLQIHLDFQASPNHHVMRLSG